MKPIYEEKESHLGEKFITATYDNGVVLLIPADPGNSDYQRYLRWLEDPTAEEGGTLS